jgi:hypothetical protein
MSYVSEHQTLELLRRVSRNPSRLHLCEMLDCGSAVWAKFVLAVKVLLLSTDAVCGDATVQGASFPSSESSSAGRFHLVAKLPADGLTWSSSSSTLEIEPRVVLVIVYRSG